jgi:hypothetical protein
MLDARQGPRPGVSTLSDNVVISQIAYFLADFFALRVFLPPFAFDAPPSAIRKSSAFLPDLIAAVSQRGFNPRPAQVSAEFSGLRYLGATAPREPNPRVTFDPDLPPWNRPSFASSGVVDLRPRSSPFFLFW